METNDPYDTAEPPYAPGAAPPVPSVPSVPPEEPAFVTGVAYGVLVVVGVALGLIGSFEFSWTVGDVPVAALGLTAVNLAAFRLAGWAMHGKLGAVVAAVPWMLVTVILSGRRPEGDLIVTGTVAGYIYIFGGSIAAVAAVAWTRSARPWLLHGAPTVSDPRP